MKITLSRVEYSPRLSEETNAFTAIVCIDGVPAFEVSNRGNGGCDDHHPLKGQTYEQMRAKIEEVQAYAKTLPNEPKYNLEMDLDLLVGNAFEEWLTTRDLKKMLKAKLLFTKSDGKVYGVKRGADWTVERMPRVKELYRKNGAVDFLEDLPFDAALEIFRKNAA